MTSTTTNLEQRPVYRLEGVSKVYGGTAEGDAPFTALDNVTMTIPDGAFTTIVGPSGSGKSTLLSLLGLLDRPSSGAISIDGIGLGEAKERRRCAMRSSHLAFVFQAFHLMQHRTVMDNVMLGGLYRGLNRAERQRQAGLCLEQVGLGSKTTNLASTLSGGERQRTAIARALVGEPRILLCDEPTGNLDTRNGEAIASLLTELSQSGITIIMVTHDPAIAALGNHKVHVIDGKVSGDGCS